MNEENIHNEPSLCSYADAFAHSVRRSSCTLKAQSDDILLVGRRQHPANQSWQLARSQI